MLVWIQQLKKNKKITALFLMCVVIFFVFFAGPVVLAQNNVQSGDVFGTAQIDQNTALSGSSPIAIAVRIINVGLGLLGIIAVCIVLYGGFVYMTSGGQEDKIATAKKILINGTIGLAIILSSWAIARFILSKLGEATGVAGLGSLLGNNSGADFSDFLGSAGPGKSIREHYPTRDQKDVKRNTRIAITFNDAIEPGTIIENTNKTCWGDDGKATKNCVVDGDTVQNPYYGDCFTPDGQAFNWETDCDKLKTDAISIFATSTPYDGLVKKADAPDPLAAYALTTYQDGDEKNAYTFVFKPVEFLGDNLRKVDYTVGVTSQIKKKGSSQSVIPRLYKWNFQTDTTFDFDAPTIVTKSPTPNELIPRNQAIQVIFSEPMDPITINEVLKPDGALTNLIFGDKSVRGEWKLTGFKTAEFLSDQPCGENSCGDVMYCLPEVACAEGQVGEACVGTYELLLRTGKTTQNNSFEAAPQSGITDMSGNALDGDADSVVDGKPTLPGDFHTIGKGEGRADERTADNAYWQFRVSNSIDRTAPFIETVTPNIDQEGVNRIDPTRISFSKPMLQQSFRYIFIEEHPRVPNLDEIWFITSAERINGKDVAVTSHREFGPKGVDLFYFPNITSRVKDLRQNCMYPGVGPDSRRKGQDVTCFLKDNGDYQNCVPVLFQSDKDTGCAQTTDESKILQPDVPACLNALKAMSNVPGPAPANQNPR